MKPTHGGQFIGRPAEVVIAHEQWRLPPVARASRPRRAGHRAACLLVMLALLPALRAARAEHTAALMGHAPTLALDAPVEVASAGWGPFRRLCILRSMLRPGSTTDIVDAEPNCLAVETAREDAGTWHLSMRTEARGTAPGIRFSTSCDAHGRVGPDTVTVPDGRTAPPARQMAWVDAVLQAAIEANGMARATIAPDASFVLPVALGEVTPDNRVEGGGFACRPDSETGLQDRRAIVATCTGRAAGQVAPGRGLTIDMAGRFVIDVGTGMVLRHGFASVLVMEAGASGSDPRREIRGMSRQTLE